MNILDKIENQERLFLTVFRIYWLLFFPVTFLIRIFFKGSLFDENTVVLVIYFFVCATVIVFFIQLLRSIFNKYSKTIFRQKKGRSKNQLLWLVIFTIWAWLFILYLGFKTIFMASNYFIGGYTLPWFVDLLIFFIIVSGEFIFKKFIKI